jgi:uncharacterized protein (AIM24 family)
MTINVIHWLSSFEETSQQDHGHGFFELESPYMLEVNLDGTVWTKMGSMVAYVGNIKFTREGLLEKGLGKLLKKAVSGEGTKLTKAEGQGRLYLADSGKRISVLKPESRSHLCEWQRPAGAGDVG